MSLLQKWNPLATARWNPFREMEEMQKRLAHMIDLPALRPDGGQELLSASQWSPLVDISEDDKEYLIKAELPEVKREDVKVSIDNGTLKISGERRSEEEIKNKKQHRIERSYGRFMRTFALPDDADAAKISAECKDGVLRVHVFKDPNARAKAVEIKVN